MYVGGCPHIESVVPLSSSTCFYASIVSRKTVFFGEVNLLRNFVLFDVSAKSDFQQ